MSGPLAEKSCNCPCGCSIVVPQTDRWGSWEYDICTIECPECGRRSTGGNGRDGTVDSWMTQRQVAESEAEYQNQMFDADMNEWYGRGNW